MAFYYLVLLAIVQGITEFLPVSSSAHLVILPFVMQVPDQGIVLDVAVHIGTLFAVLIYFRRDIFHLISSYTVHYKNSDQTHNDNRKLARRVVIASIPVMIAGYILHVYMPDGIRDIVIIAFATIIFALVLWWADHKATLDKNIADLTKMQAFWIGMAQMLALIPGTSRSGITMTAGLMMGLKRTDTARFSMLMSIPTIVGAGFLSVISVARAGDYQLGMDAFVSIILSFIVAYIAIAALMKWLSFSSFKPFVFYRLALGITLLLLVMM